MSDDYQRIELITGAVRPRHWTTEQKLQIIEESFQPSETVSSVARRRGVAPNLLYRWRDHLPYYAAERHAPRPAHRSKEGSAPRRQSRCHALEPAMVLRRIRDL